MASLNKGNLVDLIVEDTKLSKKDAVAALESVTCNIQKTLKKGDKVTLIGFGTFEVRKRSARSGRNPQTGATIAIKASKAPAFKPGKAFKDLLN